MCMRNICAAISFDSADSLLSGALDKSGKNPDSRVAHSEKYVIAGQMHPGLRKCA